MWRLLIRYGEAGEADFPLTGEITIGRDPTNTIWLNDSTVSRHHARLYLEGERAYVEDLGSANGVLLGEESIKAPTELRPGSVLMIGGHKLLVTWTGLGPAPSTEKHAVATFHANLSDFSDEDPKPPALTTEPEPHRPITGDAVPAEIKGKNQSGKTGCFTMLVAVSILFFLIGWIC